MRWMRSFWGLPGTEAGLVPLAPLWPPELVEGRPSPPHGGRAENAGAAEPSTLPTCGGDVGAADRGGKPKAHDLSSRPILSRQLRRTVRSDQALLHEVLEMGEH